MSRTQNLVVRYFRLLLRIFFRRIEVTGLENLPQSGGGLIVSWHPNGVIDGAVILTHFPRRIVFGARHGILKVPLFGWMLRQLGTVPIYRRKDVGANESDPERRASNRQSIDALARAVADGSFAALFPEGKSHDEPFVHELKTGAAHLYYRAVEQTPDGAQPPVIVPVALHYNKKAIFGSQVLVTFHSPLTLPADLATPDGNEEERRQQARRLTAEFDRVLREVILATESWELHHLFQRARKLIRAEAIARKGTKSQPPDMIERVRHFGRIWKNYQVAVESHSDETRQVLARVARYNEDLRALGIEDHELDGASWIASPRRAVLLLVEFVIVYLVLPPFLIIGVLVNLPTMLLLLALTKATADKYKDEASIKLLVGAIVFPLTWLLVALLVAWGESTLAAAYPFVPYAPVLTGVVAFVLSAFGGVLALQFRQIATETLRSLRVRITLTRRKRAVQRLLKERSYLFEQFVMLDRELEAEMA